LMVFFSSPSRDICSPLEPERGLAVTSRCDSLSDNLLCLGLNQKDYLASFQPSGRCEMIPDQWYAILESSELAKGRPIGVTRMGERLVLWCATNGGVVCLRDRCCHRGAALSKGKIKDANIECPYHGLQYDGTGRCTVIPANGRVTQVPDRFKVRSYPVHEAHDFIWVWWGEPRQEYPQVPSFEDIDESFSYLTLRDHWDTHYSRVIENMLDVAHLPFVHANTIGRGGKPWLTVRRLGLMVTGSWSGSVMSWTEGKSRSGPRRCLNLRILRFCISCFLISGRTGWAMISGLWLLSLLLMRRIRSCTSASIRGLSESLCSATCSTS